MDGTTNFVHSYPFTCVSIGLAVQQQPVVGVVYNPILCEMFCAAKGSGAFLNDEPISVSNTQGRLGGSHCLPYKGLQLSSSFDPTDLWAHPGASNQFAALM